MRRGLARLGMRSALLLSAMLPGTIAHAATATTTTLAVSPAGQVAAKTVVVLTAGVTAGGTPVKPGLVTFCDAAAVHCEDAAVLGRAQLTSSGTAVLKFVPGAGSHSYKAVFAGTATYTTSSSSAQTLAVAGPTPTTTIASSGSAGDYTLTATVAGTGSFSSPTGTVLLLDTTNSNSVMGNATLGTATRVQSFPNATGSPITVGTLPYSVATGDFNNDGTLDVVMPNYSSNNVSILLGNGSGGFTQSTVAVGIQPSIAVVGDFNSDGNVDFAVSNNNGGSGTVSIMLGNGNGTFIQAAESPIFLGGSVRPIVAGDFNGDGIPDLAIGLQSGGNNLYIYLGDGDGTFTQIAASPLSVGGNSLISMASADFDGDGNADLAVAVNGANTMVILHGDGTGFFAPAFGSPITGFSNPTAVATADFNGDGKPDLVVTDSGSKSLTILIGNGSGFASASVTSGVGNVPYTSAIGDFNGDGIADIAVANSFDNTVTILTGDGSGGFTPLVSPAPPAGSGSWYVAVGDFNGDGILDIAAANQSGNNASILLNTVTQTATATVAGVAVPGSGTHDVDARYAGDANFASSTSSTVPLTATQVRTTLTLTANPPITAFGERAELTATLTIGASTPSPPSPDGELVTFKNGATVLGTAPLNGGVATLAFTSLGVGENDMTASYGGDTYLLGSNSATVAVQVGATTTTTLTVSPAGPVAANTVVTLTATVKAGTTAVTPGQVLFCDATAPRCLDLAVLGSAQLTSAGTAVLKFRPGGGGRSYKAVFVGTSAYGTSTSVTSVQQVSFATTTSIVSSGSAGNYTLTATVVGAGNFTQGPTGTVSFLDTTNSNSVLGTATLGASTPTQNIVNGPGSPIAVGQTPRRVAVADFNGDGIPDIAVANFNSNSVSILLGNGSGGFTAASGSPVTTGIGVQPIAVAAGDFNSDGNVDLAVANQGANTVTILLGNGGGGFTVASGSPVAVGAGPNFVAVGDLNGDGKLDLATANINTNTITILLGNGSGGFSPGMGSPITVGTSPATVAVADLNGNGLNDLAVTNSGSHTVTILLNVNGTSFSVAPGSPFPVGTTPREVAVGDFNGDGKADLALANRDSNNVSVLLGDGTGRFSNSSGSPFAVGSSPYSVAIGNYNGDGILDLAVANFSSNNVTILLGNGSGGFTQAGLSPVGVGGGAFAIAAADLTGDGVSDLMVTNGNDNTLSILLNKVTQTATATKTAVSVPGTGTHNVAASYGGDSAPFAASLSTTIPLTASLVPTALALTASPASPPGSTYGQSVTLTGTLTYSNTPPVPPPTGETVAFYSGATLLGTGTLNSSGVATLTTTLLPVGTDSLTANYGGDSYLVGKTSSVLSYAVAKAVLTVTANNTTRAYGAANPAFTSTITGFVNGDTAAVVSGSVSLTTTATAASGVGTYPITAAVGTLSAANYSFTFVSGTLTVTKATLTVTANNATRTYGAANPTFMGSVTGALNGDTFTQSFATTATPATAVGTYAIVPSVTGPNLANYTVTPTNGTLTVTQATLTITANNATRTYGAANPTFTGSVTGALNGDTFTQRFATTATPATNVGTYAIVPSVTGPNVANYTVTPSNGTLTVTKAVLTLTANNASRAYGAANPTFTNTITGFVNGDTGSVVSGVAGSSTTTATVTSPPGTYPIAPSVGTLSAANYSFAIANGTLTVVMLASSTTTLSIAPITVMYGDPSTLTAVVSPAFATGTVGFFDGATLLGTASLDNTATAVLPVSTLEAGTHTITAKYNGDPGVPVNTSAPQTLTVTQRTAPGGGPALTVTVNDATRTTAASNPQFTYSPGGTLVNGDTYATAISGTPVYSASTGSVPGTYPIAVTGLTAANYTITFLPGTLTVVATNTTTMLAASPDSTQYGDPVTLTAAVTTGATGTVSFYNGSVLLGNGAVSGGVAALVTTTLGAGTNSITAVYNGDIAYASSISVPATVTVAKKTASDGGPGLTVTVQSASRMFGSADPAFSYVVTEAAPGVLVNGDTTATAVTGVPVYSVADTPTSPPGSTFPITVSGLSSANYDINFVPGTLTIVAASTTTTLATSATTASYGIPITLTATVAPSGATGNLTFSDGVIVLGSGTVSGGVATLTTSSLHAGSYTITAAYAGDTDYGGSTSGPVAVTVTVASSPLTVTVNDATRLTGQGNPAFTYMVTGTLLNGDAYATAVAGVPVYSTPATINSPAGTYPVSITGGLSSQNYPLVFANGALTVSPSPSMVTLTSSPNPSTYGDAVTLTATVPLDATGTVTFINQTTATTLGTGTITSGIATFMTTTLAAGTYQIQASYGGDTKYDPSSSSLLSQIVNKAVLTVAANNVTRAFGAANPTFTSTITGFVNGDTAGVVSGGSSLTTTATAVSPAGSYPITAAQGTLAAANYTFSFVDGTLTVAASLASSTVLSVAPATVMYGDPAVLSAVVEPSGATGTVSFYEGSTLLGTSPLDSADTAVLPFSTLGAGTHTITAIYNGSPNAPATTSNAVTLTATQRTAPGGGPAMTVVVNDATRATTEANPPFTYSAAGTLFNGDTYATAIIGTPVYSTSAGTLPGTFAVTVSGLTSANYTITFLPGTLTVVITPTTTTLTLSPATTQYGDPVTMTATVPAGATGTMSFFDSSVLLGQGAVSGGAATLTTMTLSAGTHVIKAVYNGDGIYESSASGPVTLIVAKKTASGGGPALTVTVQDASRMFNTANPQFSYVVTGTLVNDDTYATAVTGVPVYSVADTPASPAGSTFPVTVSGLGSQNYDLAYVPGTLTIAAASTTTALSTSATSTHYGDSITLTAAVAPSGATGTVIFQNGATVLGTGTLSDGAATFTTTLLNAGTYTITATYSGDSNFGGSTSTPVTIAVAVSTNVLTVTVNNASRLTGQGNPAFTYTPSGTLVNGNSYATAIDGVPVYSTSATVDSLAGIYPVSIGGLSSLNYTLNFVPGTLTVNLSPATLALTSSLNSSTYGDTVTLTAQGPVDATGTVAFIDQTSSTSLGTETVSNGVATLVANSLAAGTHQIVANYSGDSNYNSATSNVLSQVVNRAPLTVTANNATRAYGTANPALTATISGFVNGEDSSVVSGAPSLTTIATIASLPGTYSIATAMGTLAAANYAFTTFNNGTLAITALVTSSTTLGIAPTTVMYGVPALLTAAVTPTFATGSVSFYEGTTLLGTSALDSTATAVLPVSSMNVGTHNIIATYNGDQAVPASTSAGAHLTVTQRTAPGGGAALTIVVNDDTRTASAANPLFSYSISGGLVNNDTYATAITGTPTYTTTAGTTPGSFPITLTGLTSANYSISVAKGTLTVTPDATGLISNITLAANPTSSNYGDPVTLTATVSPGAVSGSVTFMDGTTNLGKATVSGGAATLTATILNAGTHSITAQYNGDDTYASNLSAAVTSTVAQRPLTVTVQNQSVPIGLTAPQFGDVANGTLYNGDTYALAITGAAVHSGFAPGGAAGQTFTIDVSGLSSQNYALTLVAGTATMVGAGSTTTLTASTTSTSYGSPFTLTATVAPVVAIGTVVFREGAVEVGTGMLTNGVATLTTTTLISGTHTITATYLGDTNYGASTSSPIVVTVTQGSLTVTVNNVTRLTGRGNPAFTCTVTGILATGDTYATAVTGVPVYSTSATATSPSGAYSIAIAGGLNSANYALIFSDGTLTVNQSTATLTLTTSSNPSTYGTPLTFTATLPSDAGGTVIFVDQNSATTLGQGTVANGIATMITSELPAGAYQVVANYGGDSKYNLSSSTALSQTISKAPLSVTANDVARDYGEPNPTFTETIAGFVNGDTPTEISGASSLTTTATPFSPIGTYPIVAALGNLSAVNYSFTAFINGTLTIAPSSVSATTLNIAPATVMYGDTAVLTAQVTPGGATGTVSFYEGTTLLGTSSFDVTGTAVLPVSSLQAGTHNITATYNGDPNLPPSSSHPAPLTVTQRTASDGGPALTVTVNDATRTAAQANPPFTYSATGTLVNGDSYATAITGTPVYATTAGTVPGIFSVSVSGLTSANYTVAYVPGNLRVVITPTTTTLVPNPTSAQYGDSIMFMANVPAGATGSVSFFDGPIVLGEGTVSNNVATLVTTKLNANIHSITAIYNGDATYASSASSPAIVTVAKKTSADGGPALTATVQDASRVYDTANPAFNYIVTGMLLNGDSYATAVTGVPAYSVADTAGSPPGSTYPITVSGLSSPNYTLALVPGTLTIVTAPTITALATNVTSAQYGDTVVLTANVTPGAATGTVLFTEGTTVIGTAPVSAGIAILTTTKLATGLHTVTATYRGDEDYGASTSGPVTITITQRTAVGGGPALTLTVANATRAFGQGNPEFSYTVAGTLVNGDTYAAAITGIPDYSTTATVASSPGRYPIAIVGGLYSANYTFTTVNGTLTITQAKAAVALTASATFVPLGTPVVLTATVSAIATGSVQFYNGTILLGTSAVSANSAKLTASTLPLGANSITAIYSGDANFTGAASAVVTVTVTNSADFSVSSTTPPQLIPPGASANFNIVVNSVNGLFTNPVTMTAANLPPGATYTLNPGTVTPGAAGATSALTITVPQQGANLFHRRGVAPIALALLVLPFAWIKRSRSTPPRLLLTLLLLFATLGMAIGCGAGGYFNQPQRSYIITVTGTSGSLTHNTNITLTVE